MLRLLLFLFASTTALAQTERQPAMFRWQDTYARKHMKKYVKHDTLIHTSEAVLHISYNTDPKKPYLLTLHGMGANARTNWGSQIKDLSREYNLILPDLIYFGESTSASGNFSVEFQAEQIHEALGKLGIPAPLYVMGFSYGGLTAAIYNQLYQPEIKKLILIDAPVKFFTLRMADSLAAAVGATGISNVVAPTTLAEFGGMTKAAMSGGFPATKRMKRKIIRYFFMPTKVLRDQQINYLLAREAQYTNYSYNLDKTPTLLIWGEQDGVIPASVGKALHETFPLTTTLLVFPEAKHDAHFKERKTLNKAVIAFINGS